jgi:hypothetical protein
MKLNMGKSARNYLIVNITIRKTKLLQLHSISRNQKQLKLN